jgi:lipid-binding SYLF domain-containing protein
MKSGTFLSNRKFSTILCLMLMVLLLFAGQSFAKKTAKEVDTSVDAAMERFHKQVKDAKEVVAKAKGLLILPNVKKGALIVGGEYGQGALKIGGKTVDYYSMISGSFGLQIGGQAKDIIIAFNSSEALKKFRESKGWEAGVDGNVALIKMGAGESAVAAMAKQPIAAFVFDVKGLMADMSLKGAKFNKLDKTK